MPTTSLPPSEWFPRVLASVTGHESRGNYGAINPNLDGHGLSYGIIQWAEDAGSLGPLFQRMYEADPATFQAVFGPSWEQLLAVTREPGIHAVDGAYLWQEPWASRLRTAGTVPAFQGAQQTQALRGPHMRVAIQIMGTLGVNSERALALAYNRSVHQLYGALNEAKALASWYAEDPSRRPAATNDVLAQFAWKCAAAFRSTEPRMGTYGGPNSKLYWAQVDTEWSPLRLGDYHVQRVTGPVWHVMSGARAFDLYEIITKHSSDVLTSPNLRDQPVEVPTVPVA